MHSFTAVIERDNDTGLYVGFVPGFHGAYSQGTTLDELRQNLHEVIAMFLEAAKYRMLNNYCMYCTYCSY